MYSWEYHVICVLIRVALGAAVILKYTSKELITLVTLIILPMFAFKAACAPVDWKVYTRPVIAYALAWYFAIVRDHSAVAGLVIIMDALLGLQSRHIVRMFETSSLQEGR